MRITAQPSHIIRALARLLDASYCDSPPDVHQADMWREAAHLARQEYDALRAQAQFAAQLAEALRLCRDDPPDAHHHAAKALTAYDRAVGNRPNSSESSPPGVGESGGEAK